MPNLEHELTKMAELKYLATFDLAHGYWQLPLGEDSKDLQPLVKPDRAFNLTNEFQETINAAINLHESLIEMRPSDMWSHAMGWLEDILVNLRPFLGSSNAYMSYLRSAWRTK